MKAALIALETADDRLARMDRPQLTTLRRVINQDMERLKAAPQTSCATSSSSAASIREVSR